MPPPLKLLSPTNMLTASPSPISPLPLSISIESEEFDEIKKTQKAIDPWELCNDYAKKHTSEICESWRDEVDKLLIFAGLFSGVVTSFAIESYHSVTEDPAETTVILLKTIVHQLDNLANPQPNARVDPNPRVPGVSGSARRINAFWFLSLALSLSTVMAGILCLQWLREYGRNANVPHREDVALHYMRYEGMKKWHVFKVLSALPVLLIAALLLFFAGFIEVLWEVDTIAAILVTIVVGIAFLFILMTTLLPTLQCLWICAFPGTDFSQCPYKSPQSWIFHKSVALFSYFIHRLKPAKGEGEKSSSFSKLFKIQDWPDYDRFLRKRRDMFGEVRLRDVGHGIAGIGEIFVQHQRVVEAVCRCLRDLKPDIALDASLAHMDPRRAASVHERLSTNRFLSPMKKTEYERDLIVSHTLEHFAQKMEQGHMSPILLQQRLELFLKINEGGWLDPDLECPVNRSNITLVSRDIRERILLCISLMLRKNLECGATHTDGAFEIIRSIFLETGAQDPVPPLVVGALNDLVGWIQRGPTLTSINLKPDPEKRIKQGVPFHKLVLVCKGNNDRAVVEDFRRWLDNKIKDMFEKDLVAVDNPMQRPKFPYLSKYMTWRHMEL